MASYDIGDAAGKAYRLLWAERAYLARLALVPLIVKIVCFALVSWLGLSERFLTMALVMLPTYFVDGWMLAHLVRLIYFGERHTFVYGLVSNGPHASGPHAQGPKTPGAQASAAARTPAKKPATPLRPGRGRDILAGIVAYTLVKFLLAGVTALVYYAMQKMQIDPVPHLTAETVEPRGDVAAFIIVLFGLGIWAFRFFWFYIAVALGYGVRRFVRDVRALKTSFHMIGTALICYMPVFAFFQIITVMTLAPYAQDMAALPAGAQMTAGAMIVLMDTIGALITTAGISYGLHALMTGLRRSSK